MPDQAILWGRGSSTNVQKVLWCANELGLSFTHTPLAGEYGGNDAGWFLDLNPNGTVPVWQEDGFSLYESQAILRYLARRENALYGETLKETAMVDQWLDWFALVFWPPVRLLFLDVWRDEKLTLDAPAAQAALGKATAQTHSVAQHLKSSRYMAGDAFTIADIAVVIGLNRMQGLGFDIPVPEPLCDWLSKQRQRAGFEFATADEPDLPGHRHLGAA